MLLFRMHGVMGVGFGVQWVWKLARFVGAHNFTWRTR